VKGFFDYRYVEPGPPSLKIVNPLTGDQWFNFTDMNKSVGDTFIINITIVNVKGLLCWQFGLQWNPSLLTYVSSTIPSDNVFAGQSYISCKDSSTPGLLVIGAAHIFPIELFTGSGILAQVELRIVNGAGQSPLSFEGTYMDVDTFLLDERLNDISYTAVNGYYEYMLPIHDVAIINLTSTKTIIGQGYAGNVTMTVENQGDFAENFNVTIYANTTQITVLNFVLANGTLQAKTFSWNITGFAYGNYTIWAYAEPLLGEIDVEDNNCTCAVPVHVGVPGDISGPTVGVYDGTTNMRDVNYLILLFNTNPSSPNWKPNADINNDGTVNMRDIQIGILNFNKHE
jgi:hypothetical protein